MFEGQDVVKEELPSAKLAQHKNINQLTKISDASKLLQDEHRQELIARCKEILNLSRENDELYCQSLLKNYVEFVQRIPETHHSYFCQPGGFIDHALERTSIALSACRGYFVSDGDETQALTQQQTLWMYTLFSAGLLYGVGKIYTDFVIEIYDQNGDYIRRWSPFEGPMINFGHYYDYDHETGHIIDFRRRVTILLARQIMPEAGFRWLISDKDAFEVWLALLEDDTRSARAFGPVLIQAEAEVINEYFKKIAGDFKTQEGKYATSKFTSFTNVSSESSGTSLEKEIKPSESTTAGAAFFRWLTRELGLSKFMLNEPPLFSVPGGLLIGTDMMKLFIREHPEYKSWQNLLRSLGNMKMHAVGKEGEILQNFIDPKTQQNQTGIVITNTHLILPETFKVKTVLGEILKVAAKEYVAENLQSGLVQEKTAQVTKVLSPNGQWTNQASIVNPFELQGKMGG